VNGIERLIRLLIVPRRNHAISILRNSFQKRGPTFTEFGIQMRCVRPDESSATITLHYCRDGAIFFRFSMKKQEFLIPVILVLRALSTKSTDKVFMYFITPGHI
jgi:DNA-directed RNA polymerase I subunit RPA2